MTNQPTTAAAPAPQRRSMNHRYCCRCLTDKDTKGGKYSGLMFTCAECREKLQGGPKR